MNNTKKLFEDFRNFTELKESPERIEAWKRKLYDWVKANASRNDKDSLGAAMHQVADEMMVMQEENEND